MSEILKALSEGTDAAGGFTVPDILAREVLEYVQANAVTVPDMQRVKMTSDTHLLPDLTSGQTAYWPGENTTITGSDVAFGRVTLSAKKVAALTTISTELLEDSAAPIARIITEQMGKDLALAVDTQILGTATSVFSTPLGSTASTANTYSAGTLSWTDLIEGQSLIEQADHPSPNVMYINPVNVKKLKLLTDGSARPIFEEQTWGQPILEPATIGRIMGMNVKATTTLTSSAIVMGVKGRMGYFGDRRSLNMHKDYQIQTDNWIYQSNMRVAFNTKFRGNAHALLFEVS